MKTFRRTAVPLILAVGLLLGGCSSGGSTTSSPHVGADYDMSAPQGEMSADVMTDYDSSARGSDDSSVSAEPEYLIKTASVTLQVESIEDKLDDVRTVVGSHDGNVQYSETRIRDREVVASSQGYGGDYRYPTPVTPIGDYAYLTISVPVEKLDPLLEEVRNLGEVVTDSTAQEDVTLNVLGLDARIESEVASLERLEQLLNRANSIDEVLQVERELQTRRNNIASMNAQVNSLKNRAAESTVTVQLVTDKAVELSPEEMNWFERTWDKISDGSSDTVAYSIIIVLFLVPILGLLFVVKAILDRWASHRMKKNPGLYAQNYSQKSPSPTQSVSNGATQEESPDSTSMEGVTEDGRE